jgi:hypothetical protein
MLGIQEAYGSAEERVVAKSAVQQAQQLRPEDSAVGLSSEEIMVQIHKGRSIVNVLPLHTFLPAENWRIRPS